MKTYVALLRGVNVGGKALLKMADLSMALHDAGLHEVRTYIQSGNVLFKSAKTAQQSGQLISQTIAKVFDLTVQVAVLTKQEWQQIIVEAPDWWGQNPDWKHNLLIMIKPFDMASTLAAIGDLKPSIESVEPGKGVLYQSLSFKLFGRTSSGKLASLPVYKQMTIRNYNTAHKLLALLEAM